MATPSPETQSPTPAAVRCTRLFKRFGSTFAVDGVDLIVPEGQFLALLGASGCGKTTTLRLIAGFEHPDAGVIEIGGAEVARAGHVVPPERRRVGMVFQEGALFPHMTVAANIAFGLRGTLSVDSPDRIETMLELVGLKGYGKRMPHELSGGQQQRIALARALAPNPAVVLLDEPFSSLDAGLRARLRTDVRGILRQAGATAIFVTHDQDEALSLADDVALMEYGQIVQRATPVELYEHPATPGVASFLGETTFVPGTAADHEVTTELGRLPAQGDPQGPVTVLLRPEALAVRRDPTGVGRVHDIDYYGHDCMVHVGLPSGTIVKVRLIGHAAVQRGDCVQVEVTHPVQTFGPSSFGRSHTRL